jgi:hypothetical protein
MTFKNYIENADFDQGNKIVSWKKMSICKEYPEGLYSVLNENLVRLEHHL